MTHRLAVQRPTSDPLIHVDGGRFLGRVGCRIGQLISGHAPEVRRPGSRWGGAVERLSAFQARHIPSWHESCERYRPSLIAAACCWLLLLLSPLLSAAIRKAPAAPDPARRSVPRRAPFPPARPLLGWNSPTPPPNPTAAEPRDGRVLSRPSSRVHEPCILAGSGCPAVTDGLDGFRESQILLRRVGGRPPTFPPHTSGRGLPRRQRRSSGRRDGLGAKQIFP